ncbi:RNA pseudouridine synthase, partial [Clostridiaceae bacterium OttesenSCG-928-D20]|nr:RNA pseudouridine synthase [Clostridiaceae bacterium OttesenSCG-928-D20]
GRSPRDRKKMAVTERGSKPAVTHYEVISESEKHSHLRLRLETGRTHQIRVHLKSLQRPVLGDRVYGKESKKIDGQCLHARELKFIHPKTGECVTVSSKLPDYFSDLLESLHLT